MKKWIVAIVVLGLACAAFAYYKHSAGKDDEEGPKTVQVEKGTLIEKALAVGQIVPLHEIAVKSKVSGTVAQIFVEEGAYVEAGDRLIEVKPAPTPLEYAQAKRTLELRLLSEEQRLSDLKRSQVLQRQGMVSQAELDKNKENYDQAVLQRRMADEQLAILDRGKAVVAGRTVENVITSPIAGHVLDLNVDVGDPVVPLTSYQPGTALMSLADMGELRFEGTVDEIDVGKIREGMAVTLKVGAFPQHSIEARLARIALKSEKRDNATVFEVEVDSLAAPEELVLRAGYSANADIIIRRAEDVAVLPERVVDFRGDSTFVRLPGSEGETAQHQIEIGMADGIQVEVVGGLALGDSVLEKESREIE